MSEARRNRRVKRNGKPTASASSDAQKLLLAIAQAKKAAVCIKEDTDDDLAGAVGDFILMFPSGKNIAATTFSCAQAALLYLASKRFVPWKP